VLQKNKYAAKNFCVDFRNKLFIIIHNMNFVKKYLKGDNLVVLLYEHLVLILLANLSFVISYYVKFPGNIPAYNFKPFFLLAPFYSVFVVLFNIFFGILSVKSLKELIIKSVKSVLLIVMCSMATAYVFRSYMKGIPTIVFMIATIVNVVFFVEMMRRMGLKKKNV